jgi:putative ABC transport system substrate-binding protein
MTALVLIVTLALGPLLAPCTADAQPAAKVPRIGVLRRAAYQTADFEAFRQGLRALGYIEGQNLAIEQRYAAGVSERLPTLAARTATSTIPIVFTTVGDPVATGLVASLAHPGGTLTGLTGPNPEVAGKRLELIKEAVPGAARVAVLGNPDNY